MKFFLDENISPRTVDTLSHVYKDHEFLSTTDLGIRGAPDEKLFPEIAEQGFHGIITQDKNQLARSGELRALYDNGIHWMGYKTVHGIGGLPWIAMLTGTLMSGLVLALQNWGDEPRCFKFHHAGRQAQQHFTAFEIDTQIWKPKPIRLH
ncbi:DUF5615 family PIN-like protein [Arthrobacter sp. H-02-3]|uniref:DUF5615 family PIN-like protein n=1 Tax=Arthrobacter sp. H-02-3 TaxID=2703675 RepID=UPI000DD29718|nr:DUF5615 family PIN-like protein [Arthrobacter sp. H-02-3]PVZ60837.1 hypothetical protein C9424_00055 [Arthrobacter sp. H-02-3]